MAGKKRPAVAASTSNVAITTTSPPPPPRRSKRVFKKEEEEGVMMMKVKEEEEEEEEGGEGMALVLLKEEEQGDLKAVRKPPSCSAPSPYASSMRPTVEECVMARDALAALHGEPTRSVKECDGTLLEKKAQSVLDSLVRTILSQNTTDTLSKKAFDSLKRSFPTYRDVLSSPPAAVEESIKIGGLAATKVARIRCILETVLQERPEESINGEPSLEYLREMDTEAIKAELSRFKGVGPKTIACVLMFTLMRPEFAVDTHVWHIAKRLGWVPPSASREDTYLHLNSRVPDDIKYDLHVLMVGHGKVCTACAKGGRTVHAAIPGPCPLTSIGLNGKKKGRQADTTTTTTNKVAAVKTES